MKDKQGRIIYIGKAKSLKQRLNSYLAKNLFAKTQALILRVSDIEFKLCPNESLALLLEAALVKKYKPNYNIALRDGKNFPMVKITKDKFPALCITRKQENDGAYYFGPYTNSSLLRQALRAIRSNFPYLIYKQLPQERKIDESIGLSPKKGISEEEYGKTIKGISLILQGKVDFLLKKLSLEMNSKSARLDFEGAAKIRDQINALSVINQGDTFAYNKQGLKELKDFLKMQKEPKRIEAFDISNISGKEACGSMVSFYNGNFDKNNYRKFRIKTVSGIDDYGMLREVVRRRYSRVLRNRLALPDLIIIDGGRGHLMAAEAELNALGIDLLVLAIAKEHENIYVKGNKKPFKLSSRLLALNLIRRIRDEAHRFAISYHHLLRKKGLICA